MRIIECQQRSLDWYHARIGVITASSINRVMTAAKRDVYARELAAEILTQQTKTIPVNEAMQWGIDNEEEALNWYTFSEDVNVKRVGFCLHETNDRFGCSPDGLIDENGLVEVKCPNSHNHLLYMRDGPSKDYIMQMQWQMFVTNRTWCDFVSYDKRMPANKIAYVHYIYRDNKMIGELEKNAKITVEMIEKLVK